MIIRANIYCYLILAVVSIWSFSCTQSELPSDTMTRSDTLFRYVDSTESGIDFVNEVVDQEHFNVLSYRNFYNGGGVGIGDFNNDGLEDVFFSANMSDNRLYLNKGNFKFEDITTSAGISGYGGWSTGVSLVDINHDSYLDIYVSNSGDLEGINQQNELFINNGDLTFTESASEYNLDHKGYSTHAAFFDYDGDGDLDCYILNNSFKDPSKIDIYSRTREENDELGGDRLMRNDGRVFTDVSEAAGIFSSAIGFGLGVAVGDVNNDQWPDLYISNDFWERDYLYINNQDGTFTEKLTEQMSICSVSSMGADIADINNDGYQDIFTTDMLAADNFRLKAATMFTPYHLEDMKFRSSYHYQILQNCLHINRGGNGFRETASLSGVDATDWSWGALIFDFDNDAHKDIYVSNGIYHDIMYLDFANFIDDKEEVKKIVSEKGRYDFRDFLQFLPSDPIDNYAFVNGGNLKFEDRALDLGFKAGEFSNGAAYGDLDNDGDLDLVLNNINMAASVYENRSDTQKENHYLKLHLNGTDKNTSAIGSKVVVQTSDGTIMQELYINRGFQSSVPATLNIGLGSQSTVSSVKVIWPDRTEQTISNPMIDTLLTLNKNEASIVTTHQSEDNASVTDISYIIKGPTTHVEDDHNDFDVEPLMPRMHSTEGPKLEVADVNGDGLEDFLTLGATDDEDKIFLQRADGTFIKTDNPSFLLDKSYESTCALFFDADSDGDNDLIIGSGGNVLSKGIEGYKLRYYENDGKGTLFKTEFKTPPGAGQVSVIAPADIDKDGDLDLFIGGRSVPGNYGLVPRSFLFRNDGNGKWEDITTQEIGTLGMVTDATWADFDGDNDVDLIVVGEWMPITMLAFQEGAPQSLSTVAHTHGWWLDIMAADLDGDGADEFVLGNWGQNSKFKASKEKPLTMYLKDFDDNGKADFILNWYPPLEDKAYPYSTKDDLLSQLPGLKKQNLKYADYATKDYETLLTEQQRSGAKKFICETLSSSILKFAEGKPTLTALPQPAQIAPMFAATTINANDDQYPDIWLGGNFHGLKPQAGHLDASRGVLLINDGNLSFHEDAANPDITIGEVRDAALIKISDGNDALLVARNNLPIQVLSFR